MAKHVSDTSTLELSRYVTVLRRRWKFVAIGLAIGVALAAVTIIASPGSATANTQVSVNLISSNLFNTARPASDLIDAQTEQAMARSTTVMNAVAEGLGGEWTRTAVRRATTATLQPDSTVLLISFTAPNAQRAAEGASLVAQEYLTYRSDIAQGRVDMASEPLVVRSDSLKKRLAEANRKSAAAVQGSADQVVAEMRAEEVRAELITVTAQINELAGVSTSGGTILTEADPGQVATSPNRKLLLVSGALGGLLLGLVTAFVVNVLDRRVRDAYDVAGAGGGDVVAQLIGSSAELPATGHDADELRALRERLMAASERDAPVFGVVEVADPGTGASDVGPGLAVAFADAGVATDLVLADHLPAVVDQIAEAFGMREVDTHGRGRRFRGGVAEALTLVAPSSSRGRLSTSDLLAELLEDDARGAEVTVVAVPTDAGSSARLTLGRAADQVVLVVREADTSIDQLAGVVQELQAVWAVIHGSVLLASGRSIEVGGQNAQASAGDPETEPEPEPGPGRDADAEGDTDADAEVEADADAQVEADEEGDVEADVDTGSDAGTDTEDEPESDAAERTQPGRGGGSAANSWAFDR